jgi:hypothetical protein
MFSNYERHGLAPNSSCEFGRGLLCELDPSLWNCPRGINNGDLALPEADSNTDEVELTLGSARVDRTAATGTAMAH